MTRIFMLRRPSEWGYISRPLDGSKENYLPALMLDVEAGDKVTIAYLLTKAQGYIYDGRNVGLQYYGTLSGGAYPMNPSEVGVATAITIMPTKSGRLSISTYRNDNVTTGDLGTNEADRCYGEYIKVRIER